MCIMVCCIIVPVAVPSGSPSREPTTQHPEAARHGRLVGAYLSHRPWVEVYALARGRAATGQQDTHT